MKCNNCGFENNNINKFCEACGSKLITKRNINIRLLSLICGIIALIANEGTYNIEVGDGFEIYNKTSPINSFADIPEVCKEELKAEAYDIIVSEYAEKSRYASISGDAVYLGEYLLCSKNPSDTNSSNTSYYVVYQASVKDNRV